MAQYISKSALVAEIERRIVEYKDMKIDSSYYEGMVASLEFFRDEFINTLEAEEVDNMPNIKFPHYKNIVEKVFGSGNLESFEYDEAERLVSLAKEELLKDLEVKEMELTWEDVREICTQSVLVEIDLGGLVSDEKHYTEVLKRFKAQKGE